jgi:hypothetical protein
MLIHAASTQDAIRECGNQLSMLKEDLGDQAPEIPAPSFDSAQHARTYRRTTLAATGLLNWGAPTAVADTDADADTYVNPKPNPDGYTTTMSIGVLNDVNIVITAGLPPGHEARPGTSRRAHDRRGPPDQEPLTRRRAG